jgi:chromosome segregation ATPase
MASTQLDDFLSRLEARLLAIDEKLQNLSKARNKSMEWIGTLSEHVRSLDEFREEVRATFEPLLAKLESIEEVVRILRHATSDVSRRVQEIEHDKKHRAAS